MKFKRIYLSLFVLLGFSNANAANNMLNSGDLNRYKEALDYLECYYGGNNGCGDSYSSAEARELVKNFMKKDAGGLNAAKKKDLDNRSPELLAKISPEELEIYGKYIASLPGEQFIGEFVDDARILLNMSVPGIDTLEGVGYEGGFTEAKGDSSISRVEEFTKQDLLKQMAISKSRKQQPTFNESYLENINFKSHEEETMNFNISDGGYVGSIIRETSSKLTFVAVGQSLTYDVKVKRYADHGYAMKLFYYEIKFKQKVDKSIRDEHEPRKYTMKFGFDVVNNPRDEVWEKRYDGIKQKDRNSRDIFNKIELLRYAADKALREYDNAYRKYRVYSLAEKFSNNSADFDNVHETITTDFNKFGMYRASQSKNINILKKDEDEYVKSAQEYIQKAKSLYSEVLAISSSDIEGASKIKRGVEDKAYDIQSEKNDAIKHFNKVSGFSYEASKKSRFDEELKVNRSLLDFKVFIKG